jgi:23S rRNA U2552 (ribose-2'-O)-methylase RlmE/FtsJ
VIHQRVQVTQRAGITYNPTDVVLDMGASPGGWSLYLSTVAKVAHVHAVDPGALDDSVLELPNVTHHRMKIQVTLHTTLCSSMRVQRIAVDCALESSVQQY